MRLHTARLLFLLFATTLALMADWRVHIDKKPSQITGMRNATALVPAKGLNTADLILGCVDGKPILRVQDRFRGMKLTPVNGGYLTHVKMRPSANTNYIEADVQGSYSDAAAFVILDAQLGEVLPAMKTGEFLFVQLPYDRKDEVIRFPMAGLNGALAKMADAGCHP